MGFRQGTALQEKEEPVAPYFTFLVCTLLAWLHFLLQLLIVRDVGEHNTCGRSSCCSCVSAQARGG